MPDLHPAHELAARIIEARNQNPFFAKTMPYSAFLLTDEALHRLVRLAYDASLLPEEGRFPTARLVCCKSPPVIPFGKRPPYDSPALQDADKLRRLAPTARRLGTALAIMAPNNEIRCIGMHEYADIIDTFFRNCVSTAWEYDEVLCGPLLSVHIEGPGHIRAGILPAQDFLLRGGQIRPCRSWSAIDVMCGLFEHAGENLRARLRQIEHPLIDQVVQNPNQCELLLWLVWGHLFRMTVASRHGATFVVDLEESGEGISESFPVRMDLGGIFQVCVRRCLEVSGDDFQTFRRIWQARRLSLFNVAEQIFGLSAVDGCVVLNKALNPVGFGAKLHSKEKHETDTLAGTGTRHKSAYDYCFEHQAVAVVVSQDGHLSVIASRTDGPPEVFRDHDPDVVWSQR